MQHWYKEHKRQYPKFDPKFQEELKGLLGYELQVGVDEYRLDLVNIVSIFAMQAKDKQDITGNARDIHFTKKEIEEHYDIDIKTLTPYLVLLINMHIGLNDIYNVAEDKGALEEFGEYFIYGSMSDYEDDYIPNVAGDESVMISHALNDIICQLAGNLDVLNKGFNLDSLKDNPIALQTIMENTPRIRPINTCVIGKDNTYEFIKDSFLANCDFSDPNLFLNMTPKEQVASIFNNVISDICDVFIDDHDEDIQIGFIHVQSVLLLVMTTHCYHHQDNYTALICFRHPSFVDAH